MGLGPGFEYFAFEPQKTGTYQLRVHKYRWDSIDFGRWMGLAWCRS